MKLIIFGVAFFILWPSMMFGLGVPLLRVIVTSIRSSGEELPNDAILEWGRWAMLSTGLMAFAASFEVMIVVEQWVLEFQRARKKR